MAASLSPPVETHHITGQKSTHHCRDGNVTGFQQQMKMIMNQTPGITGGAGLGKDVSQSFYEIITVRIVRKYSAPFNPSGHHMMQRTRCVYSSFSGHGCSITQLKRDCKYINIKGVPLNVRRPASRCRSTSLRGPKERCDGGGEKCVSRPHRGLGRIAAGRKLPSFLPTSLAMSSFSKAFMRRMRSLFFCGSRARLRVSFGSFFRSKS